MVSLRLSILVGLGIVIFGRVTRTPALHGVADVGSSRVNGLHTNKCREFAHITVDIKTPE